MYLQPVNAIQLLLLSQSLLFALYLISQKKLWSLSCFMLVLALHMAINMLTEMVPDLSFPDFAHALSFLYGPLIFFFVREMVYRKNLDFRKLTIHFIPSMLALPIPWFVANGRKWLGMAVIVSLVYYIYHCFKTIKHYHDVIDDTQSSASLRLNWLFNLMVIFLLIFIFDLLRYIVNFSDYQFIQKAFYLLLISLVFGFVNTIVYKGLKHPEIFKGISQNDESISDELHLKKNLGKIDDNELKHSSARLESLMKNEKLYLDPELKLSTLAEYIPLSARNLSQTLNQGLSTNFCEYINKYRIEEAKLRLADHNNSSSITEILFAVGFNSKSSFNTAFKKHTRKTPSQYRKHINQ